jgi:hypothetical protein
MSVLVPLVQAGRQGRLLFLFVLTSFGACLTILVLTPLFKRLLPREKTIPLPDEADTPVPGNAASEHIRDKKQPLVEGVQQPKT